MIFIFGGGGTGGHVVPALALADDLRSRGHSCSFIGNADSVEARLCASNNYPISHIKVQKLYRSFSIENLLFPWYLCHSIIKCRQILKEAKPHAVICTGGFVAGPVAIAASLLHIPLFFHESNSYPGLVTRYMAKRITRIFISFEATNSYLPRKDLILHGIPIKTKDQSPYSLDALGLKDTIPTILVSGGSQGSLAINKVIDAALPDILKAGYQLIWQTGKTSYQSFAAKHQATRGVHLFAFSPDLPRMLAKATLAVTRAGAMTIAELEEYKVPSILIPLPTAAENHQFLNAREQQDKGIAILLPQNALNPNSLMNAIKLITADQQKYRDKLALIPPNNATKNIVDSILAYLNASGKTNKE
ncbi:MAG: undecaprenyldiphospho-muramoylpentapeptide beta-N-acetylglucosaminyltransferase [Candidatus Cloacimonetes bacterium]|nr:undecaprenyldiphospho-muramoylpentapeptide beta-N-acetylglucosaminyltransferase [Candidatus Cloacimonadota bacterium]